MTFSIAVNQLEDSIGVSLFDQSKDESSLVLRHDLFERLNIIRKIIRLEDEIAHNPRSTSGLRIQHNVHKKILKKCLLELQRTVACSTASSSHAGLNNDFCYSPDMPEAVAVRAFEEIGALKQALRERLFYGEALLHL